MMFAIEIITKITNKVMTKCHLLIIVFRGKNKVFYLINLEIITL